MTWFPFDRIVIYHSVSICFSLTVFCQLYLLTKGQGCTQTVAFAPSLHSGECVIYWKRSKDILQLKINGFLI